jgi:hypothetical protein
MRRLGGALVAGLLAFSIAGPVAAADHPLKFDASSSAVSIGQAAVCPRGGTATTYVGRGTHLGLFALHETVCYTAFALPWIDFTVRSTYEAANGDLLYSHASGSFNVDTGQKVGPGFTFAGGTGRFAHATGGGRSQPVFDSDWNIVGLRQVGEIAYNASDRAD